MGQSPAMQSALMALGESVSQASTVLGGVEELLSDIDTVRRLASGDRKAVVVIAGGTGVGKSSLLNGLASEPISRTGAIRPTTDRPVVWHRGPYGPLRSGTAVFVASQDPILEAVILVDTPDFDSTREAHRQAVEELLRQADLCVFVTSAKRYADLAGWSTLRFVRRRDLPVYFVMNRLPLDGGDEILRDYASRLREDNLLVRSQSPRLLLIPEQEISDERLSVQSVAPLRRYLDSLRRPELRQTLTAQAERGRLRFLAGEAERLAGALEDRERTVRSLQGAAEAAFAVARDHVRETVISGARGAELESSLVAIGESAAAATLLAWSKAVSWDLPDVLESDELEERTRKAVATWEGSRPEDRTADQLAQVLGVELALLGTVAANWGPPVGLAGRLRTRASEVRSLG